MAARTLMDMVRDIGRSERLQSDLTQPDAELLERFVRQRDEAAFEAILHRHAPLVYGVCRRLLYNPHDAADAFQATFLVLARKAGAVGRGSLLGNWLYGVALRVAGRVRRNMLRQRAREPGGADLAHVPAPEKSLDSDLTLALHEEVQRLPDKYRGPIVLCYLEGKTGEEAAKELNCPATTVKGRLALAREMLRSRLARRGVALTAGLLAINTLTASAPVSLLDGTFQAALSFAAGGTVIGGASAQALALSMGVIRTMLLNKLKVAAALLLSGVLLAGGIAYYSLAADPPAKDKAAEKPKDDKDAILGTWKVASLEMEGKDAPDDEETKRIKSSSMVFTKEKLVAKFGEIERTSTYKLDPTKKPKTIDINHEDKELVEGVYTLEGDTLKVCFSHPRKGGARPAEVATKEGSGTMMLVLKREAKDKGK